MSKNKDSLKTILILVAIALIAGALLGLFYQITFITDEEKDQRAIKKLQEIDLAGLNPDYKKVVFESTDEQLNKNIQGFFEDEEAGIYAIIATGDRGFKDKVPLYVIIKDDEVIALKEGAVKETPGVSDAAFSDSYFDSLLMSNGLLMSIDELDLFLEDIDDVDTAIGATFSSRAVISSLKNAVSYYMEFKAPK